MSMFTGTTEKASRLVSWQVIIAILGAVILHFAIAGYFLLPKEHNNNVPIQASPQVFEVSIVAAPKSEQLALPVGPKQQESTPMKQQRSEPETTKIEPLVKPIIESKSDFTIKDKLIKPAPSKPLKRTTEKKIDVVPKSQPNSTTATGASEQYVDQTSAPAALPVKEAKVASGPVKGALSEHESSAKQLWQSALQLHLERKKRYPRMAKLRGQQGIPWVSFTMDREGNVLDVTLFKPSGIATLDQEVIELVRRAEPLPAPPNTVTGDPISMAVPVAFFIH